MPRRRLAVLALLLPPLLPAPASAQKVQDTYFNSIIPIRVDHLIGFAPTTFVIHPRDEPLRPISVRSGGRRYRFVFGNAAAGVGPSATIYMRNMIRVRRTPGLGGVFLDRRMTAFERRRSRRSPRRRSRTRRSPSRKPRASGAGRPARTLRA